MADPTFTTREALEAWLDAESDAFNQRLFEISHAQAVAISMRIDLVVAAHRHLLEEQADDLPKTKSLP